MRSFQPRLDILPAAQRRLWLQLRPTRDMGLVLYGGTAIALRLGHRASFDFAFFTERPIARDALTAALSLVAHATVLQVGRVGEPELTDDGVLQVASLDDLLATKLKVLLQRVEAKDYGDIATLLRAGVELAKALAAARIMYGLPFQPSECLKALVYFEGGDLHSLAKRDRDTLIQAVRAVRDLPAVALVSRTLSA
jgi:hypothetical protein